MKDKKTPQAIEVRAKTVDEAIKKALSRLEVPKNKVKIEVLCEGDKGLFGIEGARPALVRIVKLE